MGEKIIAYRPWNVGYLLSDNKKVIAFNSRNYMEYLDANQNKAADMTGGLPFNKEYQWYLRASSNPKADKWYLSASLNPEVDRECKESEREYKRCAEKYRQIENDLVSQIFSRIKNDDVNFTISNQQDGFRIDLQNILSVSALINKCFDYQTEEVWNDDRTAYDLNCALYKKNDSLVNRLFSPGQVRKLNGIFRVSEVASVEIKDGTRAFINVGSVVHEILLYC